MNTQEIRCLDIHKSFGKTTALRDVSLSFPKGIITGLIGRNGAGKTTLLNVIANRLPPNRGSVEIDGLRAFENDAAQEKIHYMTVANLFPLECKVAQAFKHAQQLCHTFDPEAAQKYAEIFDLPLKYKIRKLSTGMQSIFKITLALATKTDYLLLDEPILGLDANSRDLFYRLLVERQAETDCGIVLSTHLIEEVAPLLEEIALLDQGKVIAHTSVEDLLANHHILSGPEATVRTCAEGQKVISEKILGSHLALGIAAPAPLEHLLPSSVQASPYTLQALVVDLTGPTANNHSRKEL